MTFQLLMAGLSRGPRCAALSRRDGCSLVELMVSLSVGLLLSASLFQSLIGELQSGQRLTRHLRERRVQQRTLELLASDVSRAQRISSAPLSEQHACPLAGRLPVLHLSTSAGPITYSVGSAPSPIWRGQVLMRCGPAFGLDGRWSLGSTAQNRVLIDGLAARPQLWRGCASLLGPAADPAAVMDLAGSSSRGFSACLAADSGLLAVRLLQDFQNGAAVQRLHREELVAVANPSGAAAG